MSRVVLGGILGRNEYKNRLIIGELSAYKFILLGQGFYPFYPRWSCLLVDWVGSPLRWPRSSELPSLWQVRMIRQVPWLDRIGGGTLRLEEEQYCTANCVA